MHQRHYNRKKNGYKILSTFRDHRLRVACNNHIDVKQKSQKDDDQQSIIRCRKATVDTVLYLYYQNRLDHKPCS